MANVYIFLPQRTFSNNASKGEEYFLMRTKVDRHTVVVKVRV
jgi:hypothetical protein